jgi:sec-independent protein translocase protein TatB
MNIFSNIGITELVVVLLIALLVVGPERLPEMGRKLAEILRDFRKAYENLTRDLGPELQSLQQTTQELRDSVDSVRTIPQDVIQTVMEAADLDDTIEELKGVTGSIEEAGKTMSAAGQIVKNPVGAAVDTAREALMPSKPEETEEESQTVQPKEVELAPAAVAAPPTSDEPALVETSEMVAEARLASATGETSASDDPSIIEEAEVNREVERTESKEPEAADPSPEEPAHE